MSSIQNKQSTAETSVIRLSEKLLLTLEEAAQYSGIGIHKLREITNRPECPFVVWNGTRRLIKRKGLEQFIDNSRFSL